MKVFNPDLPSLDYVDDDLYRDAIYYGRKLVLDDLAQNPEREIEHYARAAICHAHASAFGSKAPILLAALGETPRVAALAALPRSFFLDHKRKVTERFDALGFKSCVQYAWMQGIALGVAQAADAICHADDQGRGHPSLSLEAFLRQGGHVLPPFESDNVDDMPEVARPRVVLERVGSSEVSLVSAAMPSADPHDELELPAEIRDQPHGVVAEPGEAPGVTAGKTCGALISEWLQSKGQLSRAEQSRQRTSARHLVTALGLTDLPAESLASLRPNSLSKFAKYIEAYPLTHRGERARIAHIKAFLEYARTQPIEVRQLDWDSLIQGGPHG